MKKYLGYLIVIIVGVLGFILMIERADQVDNNLAENNNKEEIISIWIKIKKILKKSEIFVDLAMYNIYKR